MPQQRVFRISWPDDRGPMWFNRDNLLLALQHGLVNMTGVEVEDITVALAYVPMATDEVNPTHDELDDEQRRQVDILQRHVGANTDAIEVLIKMGLAKRRRLTLLEHYTNAILDSKGEKDTVVKLLEEYREQVVHFATHQPKPPSPGPRQPSFEPPARALVLTLVNGEDYNERLHRTLHEHLLKLACDETEDSIVYIRFPGCIKTLGYWEFQDLEPSAPAKPGSLIHGVGKAGNTRRYVWVPNPDAPKVRKA